MPLGALIPLATERTWPLLSIKGHLSLAGLRKVDEALAGHHEIIRLNIISKDRHRARRHFEGHDLLFRGLGTRINATVRPPFHPAEPRSLLNERRSFSISVNPLDAVASGYIGEVKVPLRIRAGRVSKPKPFRPKVARIHPR